MLVIITGGSKCGKSSLAERILEQYSLPKYYIATMQPFGEEAHAAIERHRRQRAGKGYTTIEKYTDLGEIRIPKPGSAVLLECMGNLCANEMFREEPGEHVENRRAEETEMICKPAADRVVEKIVEDIEQLRSQTGVLVIVSNQVGSDGILYTPETTAYLEAMGRINASLSAAADVVIESVYGIPFVHKGQLPVEGSAMKERKI